MDSLDSVKVISCARKVDKEDSVLWTETVMIDVEKVELEEEEEENPLEVYSSKRRKKSFSNMVDEDEDDSVLWTETGIIGGGEEEGGGEEASAASYAGSTQIDLYCTVLYCTGARSRS